MGFQLPTNLPQLVSFLPGFLNPSTGDLGKIWDSPVRVGDFQLAIPMWNRFPPAAPLGTNLVGAGGLATGALRCWAEFFVKTQFQRCVQQDSSFRN